MPSKVDNVDKTDGRLRPSKATTVLTNRESFVQGGDTIQLSREKSTNVSEEKITIDTSEEVPFTKTEVTRLARIRRKYAKQTWVTREIAEILGREYILLTTLRDTLFFGIFLILMTTVSLGAIEPESYHLFNLMEDEMLAKNDFYAVNTPAQFWDFLENFFTTSFYWDYWYYPKQEIAPANTNERYIFYENKLIGVPRLRQMKVRGDSCIIHSYFKRIFLYCYGKFNRDNEDTATFGPGSDTAWKFTPESELRDARFWGKFGWYHGGGFYRDLSLDKNDTLESIQDLMSNLWITRGTRAIFLDWTMYNTNLNIFMQFRLAFEFPRTGGIIATPNTHMCKLLRYIDAYDYFILACEIVCIIFLIYYTFEEIREAMYFKWDYIWMFWSWIDFIVLSFGYSAIGIRVYAEMETQSKLAELFKTPNVHANMQVLMQRMLYYKLILSWQLFFIYMKIFKYLNFNKSMAQLNKTLSQCRKDMFGFGIMFFVIFIAFAILGYLIFGMEVHTFSTFYLAMFTLLRTILGDFDYTDIEKANRVIAPIFFLLFIFLVFFVLLNMFLAIINDTYVDVKTELAIAPEEMRMSGFIKRGYYNALIKMGLGRYVKLERFNKNEFDTVKNEIKGALKRIGFSDLEIEMFFARFNIDAAADIENFDMEKLLKQLEGNLPTERTSKKTPHKFHTHDEPMVVMDDFLQQQEQLKKIEASVYETTQTLQHLMKKLEHIDDVRKTKVNEDK